MEAKDAEIENALITKATVKDLEAAEARIEDIEADYIKAENLEAYRLKADKISVEELTVNGRRANWQWLNIITSVGWQRGYVKGVDGDKTSVITDIQTSNADLYVIVS